MALASLNFKTIRLGSCLYDQWLKEKSLFDEQLNAVRHDEELLSSEVSAGDFLDHLLDVHRRICRVCGSATVFNPHAELPTQQSINLRSPVSHQSPSSQHPVQHLTDTSPTIQYSPQSHSSRNGELSLSHEEDSTPESHTINGENCLTAPGGADNNSPASHPCGDGTLVPEGNIKSELAWKWNQNNMTKERSYQGDQNNSSTPSPEPGNSRAASWAVHTSSDPQDSIVRLEPGSTSVVPEPSASKDHAEGLPSQDRRNSSHQQSFSCWDCGQRFADVENLQQHCIHSNCRQQRDHLNFCHDNSTSFSNYEENATLGVNSESEPFLDHTDPSGQQTCSSSLHVPGIPFPCNFCGKVFTHKSSLNIHLKMHGPVESHICNICNRSFTHKGNLTRHRQIHNSCGNFSCLVCKQKFKYRNNLYVHVMTKHSDTQYASGIRALCIREQLEPNIPKTSQASQLPPLELVRHHPENTLSMQCSPTETYAERDQLRRGSASLDEDPPTSSAPQVQPLDLFQEDYQASLETRTQHHACDICNKVFSQSNNLKRHRRIHTNEKPYKCDVCQRGFAQSNTLKEHRHIHSNHKGYSCSACGKRFRQRSSVDKHKKINSTHGIVECTLCGQKFTHKCTLRLHMTSHVVF